MSDASQSQWSPWVDRSIRNAVERATSLYALIEETRGNPTKYFSESERKDLIPKLDAYITSCEERAYLDAGAWQERALWEKLRKALAS